MDKLFDKFLKNKRLHIPYILSIILTLLSFYFYMRKNEEMEKVDEKLELYYEIALQFAKMGCVLLNISFSLFFVYICYIGGYFKKFQKKSFRFHIWLLILTLLIVIFTLIFLLITSKLIAIEILLTLNGVQCLILIASLWEQRIKYEIHIHKMTRQQRQLGTPILSRHPLYRIGNVPEI